MTEDKWPAIPWQGHCSCCGHRVGYGCGGPDCVCKDGPEGMLAEMGRLRGHGFLGSSAPVRDDGATERP